MLRAAIYARVSSDPNNRGKSVADQIAECEAVCEREGWKVVKVFPDNDRSASRYATKDRPKYKELIEFLRAGSCDVLVTWESSRFQRDLELYVKLREYSRECGVLWSYSGRTYDLDRMDDRMSTGLDALLAERESDQIRERVLRGLRSSAIQGLPHARTPYGYRREYDPVTKALVGQFIREDQAAVVREAAQRIAAGDALTGIATDFNERGIPTAKGVKWLGAMVRELVMRPTYIGKRSHHGVLTDGIWDAILSEETYYACVQRLNAPERRTAKDNAVRHLVTGVGRCGVCGAGLRTSSRRGYHYYACRGLYAGVGQCVSMTHDRVDEYVNTAVVERLARPDATELLGDDTRAEEAKAAAAEAAEKRVRLDEFYDLAASGELTAAALARIEGRLLPEIEAAERGAAALRTPAVLRDVIRPDIAEVWPLLPITRRREIVRTLMQVTLMKEVPGSRKDPSLRISIVWKHERAAAE
ncbi:recombinase family protein [Streptomyces sp. N2-109]|uniref:Recombinase family protein n=1 Tax=Streptomyces gossypii TaxID=2883101 RepID=A0ABT2JWE7_9ACTN|nr:recombinase family protein [Streptomyces gossypii]MCT2592229.1 recombinase family protein [Streptomyces gossypii]